MGGGNKHGGLVAPLSRKDIGQHGDAVTWWRMGCSSMTGVVRVSERDGLVQLGRRLRKRCGERSWNVLLIEGRKGEGRKGRESCRYVSASCILLLRASVAIIFILQQA